MEDELSAGGDLGSAQGARLSSVTDCKHDGITQTRLYPRVRRGTHSRARFRYGAAKPGWRRPAKRRLCGANESVQDEWARSQLHLTSTTTLPEDLSMFLLIFKLFPFSFYQFKLQFVILKLRAGPK